MGGEFNEISEFIFVSLDNYTPKCSEVKVSERIQTEDRETRM